MRPSPKKKIAFSVDKRGKLRAFVYRASSHSAFGRWLRIPVEDAKLLLSTEQAVAVPYNSQYTTTTQSREYKPIREGEKRSNGATHNPRRAKRNGSKRPAVKTLYESFSGKRARRENVVTAPKGTPGNVAKLGRLRLIQTTDGRRWKFSGNDAPFLAADHKQKLHVVGGRYRANPAGEECGEIERIEYETSKPHLGQDKPAIYFHELGEETGERPSLIIDGDGLIRIKGGEYWIEADGIHN